MAQVGIAFWLVVVATLLVPPTRADWPTVRGNPERTGRVDADLPETLRFTWAVEWENERLGTAMEPIVAGDRVFIGTHAGRLWALDAASGVPAWRFEARSPLLHAPAVRDDLVVSATADGSVFAVRRDSGALAWHHEGDPAGYAASPLILEDQVFIGSRSGLFAALDLATGETLWERELPAPIRQTAAGRDERIWVTGEDLVTRCFARQNGRQLWASRPAPGQSARDYYPVVTRRGDRNWVIVRTAPLTRMSDRIERDRTALVRHAAPELLGADWRRLEAWTTNAASTATPDRTRRESEAIRDHLDQDPDARTFHVYDAATGRSPGPAPILWVGGCQGVPTPPAALPDGRLLVILRSAYGHWSRGVAPLVALGIFDPDSYAVEVENLTGPPQPPWNTFWGTADEAQNHVPFANATVLVHQGTLSRFDTATRRLRPIAGERDTYGGLAAPPWARNEWHGPARGGVAWSGNRLFWLTGSRVLCLSPHGTGRAPSARTVRAQDHALSGRLPVLPAASREDLSRMLRRCLEEILGPDAPAWAPLELMPGLGGGSAHWGQPGDLATPLALAWPHLDEAAQDRIRERIGGLGSTNEHPLALPAAPGGKTRSRAHHAAPARPNPSPGLPAIHRPPPFSQLAGLLHTFRRLDPDALDERWPEWVAAWDAFRQSGWQLSATRGDLHANRILTSIHAFAALALEQDEPGLHDEAMGLARRTEDALVAWWQRAARDVRTRSFEGIGALDAFIAGGDGLFFRVAPHRHRLALFNDLTPDIARLVRDRAPEAVDTLWRAFEQLCPTWWLVGEERQVHGGENLFDTPDVTLAAFRAYAYLRHPTAAELAARIDIPASHADLDHVTKIAITLDAFSR